MAYTNNNGQVRIGVRSGINNSPIVQPAFSASLLQSLYGVWNGDADGSGLTASIYSVWNGSGTNNQTVKNAWNANGNVTDSKGGANGTIVVSNGTTGVTTATMSFGTGKIGSGAFTFNGNNFIKLPADTFKFTGDFSVSMWVYIPSSVTSDTRYANIGVPLLTAFDNQNGYTTYRGWGGLSWYNNQMRFDTGGYSYGGSQVTSISATMSSMNQWVHIVGTRKYASTTTLYINGVKMSQANITYVPAYNSNNLATIGGGSFAFSYPWFYGTIAGVKIDAVQTWDGIELDQTAVTELYNSGNGQEYPFTVSNAKIQSTADSVGTNNGIRPTSTLNSNILGPTFTTGKIGTAFQFDGINDFIQLPNNSMNFTGDFSISAWLYFPTDIQLTSDYGHILSNWTAITWATNLAGWRFDTSGNGIYFTTYNGTSTSVSLGAPGMGLDRSGWRHIAFTKTGTTYKLWLDGGQYTSTSTTMLEPKYQGTIIPKIGRLGDSTMGGWDSYSSSKIKIDSVSVWNRSLNSDEIFQLYNAGNGTQYPFSGYLPSSANQFGVDNGTLTNGCAFGDGKIGKAFQFDGINDYVSLPTNSLSLGVDFSISLWVNLTSLSTRQCFVGSYNFNPSTGGMYGFRVFYAPSGNTSNTGGVRFDYGDGLSSGDGYYGSSSRALLTNNYLTTNTWYHIVVTKKSSSAQIYINGSLAASNTDYVQPTYSGNTYPTIGVAQYLQNQFDWYMSSGSKIDGINIYQKELTQADVTELYNSGNGKQITKTPIVQTGLVLNLDASRKSSYVGSGTTWNDISGNGYSGTLTNGPSFAQLSSNTDISGLFIFDGVNDYVTNIGDLSTFSFIQNTGVYTISAWVKPNSLNTEMYYLGNNDGTTAKKGFYLGNTGTSNSLVLEISNGSIGAHTLNHVISNFYTSAADWVNIVCVGNGVNNKVYKNGVLFNTSNFSTFSTGNTSNTLSIGRVNSANLWYWNGFVSSVNIYNKSLSDSEVLQNYNATKSRFGY
jgi:hypothetical protein